MVFDIAVIGLKFQLFFPIFKRLEIEKKMVFFSYDHLMIKFEMMPQSGKTEKLSFTPLSIRLQMAAWYLWTQFVQNVDLSSVVLKTLCTHESVFSTNVTSVFDFTAGFGQIFHFLIAKKKGSVR